MMCLNMDLLSLTLLDPCIVLFNMKPLILFLTFDRGSIISHISFNNFFSYNNREAFLDLAKNECSLDHSFSLLYRIPLYDYTKIYLSIPLPMGKFPFIFAIIHHASMNNLL